jgi:uracil-DNA glycosylase family 4
MAYLADSMSDMNPADELLELTRQVRAQLARHIAAGAWAAPGGATARSVIVPFDTPVGDAIVEEIEERPTSGRRSLAQVREELGECTRCKLSTTRKSIVFGVGDPNAPLMFVGEAPGEQEDKRGEPFVGPAGELLDKMIEAMGWSRRSVYIANTTKCLRYNARVQLGDGSWERIGRLVARKYSGTVMSVDDQGALIAKRVTGWHSSPLAGRGVYRLSYEGAKTSARGPVSVQLTGDHEVLTDKGYVAVEKLPLGARVATGQGLTDVARDVVYGTLLGDGHITKITAYLSFSHAESQSAYAEFKARLLGELNVATARFAIASGSQENYPVIHVRTRAHRSLHRIRADFYQPKKVVPAYLADGLTARMVAIWFMDDGHTRIRPPRSPSAELATCAFTPSDLEVLCAGLKRLGVVGRPVGERIQFSVVETRKLSELIARFVPECMRYKLHPEVAAVIPFDSESWTVGAPRVVYERAQVDAIEHHGTDKTFYCIDVEDNHNFVTSGGVVHNCRPPGNRNPQPDELEQCMPFLKAQIDSIAPRIIVALGRPAANQLLGRDAPISVLRNKFHDRNGVRVMPTFHPAYLLREPDKKRDTWADLKLVMAELQRLGIAPPGTPRG